MSQILPDELVLSIVKTALLSQANEEEAFLKQYLTSVLISKTVKQDLEVKEDNPLDETWKELARKRWGPIVKDTTVLSWKLFFRRRYIATTKYKTAGGKKKPHAVQGCGNLDLEWDYKCPVLIEEMEEINYSRSYCTVCDQKVHFCDSQQQLEEMVRDGYCVSFVPGFELNRPRKRGKMRNPNH